MMSLGLLIYLEQRVEIEPQISLSAQSK